MCGIAGLWRSTGTTDADTLKAMTDALAHRGPDAEGLWIDPAVGLGLGHRRLSIIDLSDAGAQPMHDPSERYTVVFNGEVYNYVELRAELEQDGVSFRGHSDTEVLLHLYAREGVSALARLDGMFAFAIWDREERELVCARDRFGEKPFYYSTHGGDFAFASEPKALFRIGVPRRPRRDRVFAYLLYDQVVDYEAPEGTFFEGVHSLPPAHVLRWRPGREPAVERYWSLDTQQDFSGSDEEAAAEFRRLLDLSVERRLRSDVPVGSSLSGGLDSSAIVASVAGLKAEGQAQYTFSARFPGFERDESRYIDIMLRSTGLTGFSVTPTADDLERDLVELLRFHEEPVRSASVAVQTAVMQLAREHDVTVLLDGQGADEMLAGYGGYYRVYAGWLEKHDPEAYRRERTAFEALHSTPLEPLAASGTLRSSAGDLARRVRPPESDYFRGIHPDLVKEHRRLGPPRPGGDDLQTRLFESTTRRGLEELLRYADRNSMRFSREVRLPFLQHELVEFVFSLPDRHKLRDGWTKYVLRDAMADRLPDEIRWRTDKIGYEPPQAEWLKAPGIRAAIDRAIEALRDECILAEPKPDQEWAYLTLAGTMGAL